MKKLLISAVLLFLCMSQLRAQTLKQVAALASLAKTWGLLKYYHPNIATGKHDWDSILIAGVKGLLLSKDNAQSAIDRMLKIAGPDTASLYQLKDRNAICYKNYDVSWIDHCPDLRFDQKRAFHYIAKHPYSGTNYYAQPNPDNDSTVFTPNEKRYQEMAFPDVNYRLLTLFRFWNVINYYYPYKYEIGKPWEKMLNEMIPIMIHATDSLSYYKALAKMAASVNDSHGGLWPEVYTHLIGKYSPPFNFKLIDGKAIVTKVVDSSLVRNGLKVGSVIKTIDGQSLKARIKAYWGLVPASNDGGKLKAMAGFILNTKGQEASFAGSEPNRRKFKVVVGQYERNFLKDYLDFFEMTKPVAMEMVEKGVGYVYFSNINKKNIDSVMGKLLDTKAIIFDMRNYPTNGTGIYDLPAYFLVQPSIYARNTYPDFALPGMMKYKIANEGTAYAYVGKNNTNPYQGKVILLVDSRTQSAAEWACMTLKTGSNVTVVGEQTAGANGNVTRTILPGGYAINFSGLGIYYPDGTATQRRGIRLDIRVKYTIQDVINKKDPILNRAIEFAKTGR